MTNIERVEKYSLKELEEALCTLADESGICALNVIAGYRAYITATCRDKCGDCIHDWFNAEVGEDFY